MHLVQINKGRSVSAEDVAQVRPLRPTSNMMIVWPPSPDRFCITDMIKTKL